MAADEKVLLKWPQKPGCPYTIKSLIYQNVMGESKLADIRMVPIASQDARDLEI